MTDNKNVQTNYALSEDVIESDIYNLNRFVEQQKQCFERAYKEILGGKKQSHWSWYVVPQIIGLGRSSTSIEYAIKSIEEAKAYLEHPYLGENTHKLCEALLSLETDDAERVMGFPDNLKLRSCMTLFLLAAPEDELFKKVLDKYYHGRPDEKTVNIVNKLQEK